MAVPAILACVRPSRYSTIWASSFACVTNRPSQPWRSCSMPTDTTDSLRVLANQRLAGQLLKEQQRYVFQYNQEAATSDLVSLTMPVRTRSYEHQQLLPIFDMHLPEGYLLAVIQRHFSKIIGNDDLSILNLLAPYIRGRLQYQQTQASTHNQTDSIAFDTLLNPHENLFEELVERFALSF